MGFRDFIRVRILGSSLVIPNTNDIFTLFVYEFKNSFPFLLYLAFVVLFIISSCWLGWRRSKKTYLLYTLGFSLIFCAFVLQKSTSIELKKNSKTSFLTSNEKTTASVLHSFLKKSKRIYHKVENLIGVDKGSLLLGNQKTSPSKIGISNLKVLGNDKDLVLISQHKKGHHNIKHTTKNNKKNDVKNVICVEPKVNTKESHIKDEDCKKSYNEKQSRITNDSTIDYLIKLQEVFVDQKENMIGLKRLINNLSQLESKSKEEMTSFKVNFDDFMKRGKVIETEMLGFNAPIRFLPAEYENLINEIDKYFYLTKHLKNEKFNPIPLIYVENILKTRKILDGRNNEEIINTDKVYKHIKYIKILALVLTLLIIANFVVVLLDISALHIFISPCLSLVFCLFIISGIVALLDAQILDRNCKTGTVKDCNFDLDKSNDYVQNIRRTEFLTQSEVFKNDVHESLKGSEKRTYELNNYIRVLMKDRLYEKIEVFVNLFDKIIFVNENFDDLTGHKIDSDSFYVNIRNMIKSLEAIKNMFSEDLKEEALKIFTNELKYCYFILKQKDEIVSKTKSIILGKTQRKSNKKVKGCLKVLEELCITRDKLDEIFLFITIFSPLLLWSIIL
ncbi:hypothetical protein NGRA_0114 [Nosema granulosis]|uniref:Uncharacterized protein n=1 Tax=Nosema granulosis TaxID=83296 RepID=A0A9P6H108_9MICR|nr:hypothetical protein NGRA_0114 [Nosema granulosis]